MSLAWEITADDVATVLENHGVQANHEEIFDGFVVEDGDHIEGIVLQYTDFDDQCNASLSEIEDILVEHGFVTLPKKYTWPNVI